MAIRAKVRRTARRGRAAVSKMARTRRSTRSEHPGHRKSASFVRPKHPSNEINSFGRALRFISSLSDYERMRIVRYTNQNFDLDRMRTLLRKLGNPHEKFRSVHIAGTKGKGSTAAMVAAMLEGNGYKVGLYTSPHLVDIRERIQINGEMIPQAEFARLVRMVQPMIKRARPTPSYFDVLTAIAFKYFAEEEVDIAIIETGLGG